jgi:hypothetical protein
MILFVFLLVLFLGSCFNILLYLDCGKKKKEEKKMNEE